MLQVSVIKKVVRNNVAGLLPLKSVANRNLGLWKSFLFPVLCMVGVIAVEPAMLNAAEQNQDQSESSRQIYFQKISPLIQANSTLVEFATAVVEDNNSYQKIHELGSKEAFFSQAMYYFFEFTQSYSNSKAAMVAAIIRAMEEACKETQTTCNEELFVIINESFQQNKSSLASIQNSPLLLAEAADSKYNSKGLKEAVDRIVRQKCSNNSGELVEKSESATHLSYKFNCGASDGGVIGFNRIYVLCDYNDAVNRFECK